MNLLLCSAGIVQVEMLHGTICGARKFHTLLHCYGGDGSALTPRVVFILLVHMVDVGKANGHRCSQQISPPLDIDCQ